MKFDIFESFSDIILKKDIKPNQLDIYKINMWIIFVSFYICIHLYELYMNNHILLLS